MGYATYLTASPHTLDKYYRRESDADSRITAAAAETPSVAFSKTGNISLPDDALFGSWGWDAANTKFGPPLITKLDAFEQLKIAGKGWREQSLAWRAGLDEEAPGHLREYQTLGESFLLGGLRAGYIIMRDSAETVLNRTKWGLTMPYGASDIISPFTFYQKVEGLTLPDNWVMGTPLSWVVVSSSERRTLQASINAAATDFPRASSPDWSSIRILSDEWIDAISS